MTPWELLAIWQGLHAWLISSAVRNAAAITVASAEAIRAKGETCPSEGEAYHQTSHDLTII